MKTFKKVPVHFKVFVTKALKFRVSILEPGKPLYEVTIGGDNWKGGRGQEYKEAIKIKIGHIMDKLRKETRKI